jgi:hypothetical protein
MRQWRTMDAEPPPPIKPRYRWPWFVLAAILLAIVLAIAWMGFAVHRLREYREPYAVPPATNR